VKRFLLVFAAVTALVCTYSFGAFRGVSADGAVTLAGWLAIGGAVAGGLLSAAHVRERRAWSDLRDARARVKATRRAWWSLAGVSARRYGLLGLAVLLGAAWWRGR
jgi:hypothetical protein